MRELFWTSIELVTKLSRTVRFTSIREENEIFFIRVCKLSQWESLRKTISINGGLGLLQMISGSDTEQCDSEEAEPWKGVNMKCANKDTGSGSIRKGNEWRCANKDTGSRRRWINQRRERITMCQRRGWAPEEWTWSGAQADTPNSKGGRLEGPTSIRGVTTSMMECYMNLLSQKLNFFFIKN